MCKKREQDLLALFPDSVPVLGAPGESSSGSRLALRALNVRCKLSGQGDKLRGVIWCQLPSSGTRSRIGPAMLPEHTCASGTNWTRFLSSRLQVHPWSLWRNGASKRLQLHLPASGREPARLIEAVVMLLPAAKRKSVLQTLCILTSYPCQGSRSEPKTSQRSEVSLGQ